MLTPFQCLQIGAELYLASKLTKKAMLGRMQFVRYIRVSIALRYGTSRPRVSSSFSLGRKKSFLTSSDLKNIGELKGGALST
jgi:hypothetical protein